MQMEIKPVLNNVSDEEFKIVTFIRSLKPYEKIEIKLNDNKIGEIAIVVTTNHKEVVHL